MVVDILYIEINYNAFSAKNIQKLNLMFASDYNAIFPDAHIYWEPKP
jgi:hypothetical protein